MYPYTKELTLDEALQLKDLHPEVLVFYPFAQTDDAKGAIKNYYLDRIYAIHDNVLQCDALTYATHILNQQAPPEGWGYAAYELTSGRYYNLNYYYSPKIGQWKHNPDAVYSKAICDYKNEFHRWSFLLTDLARVEEQTEASPIPPSGIKPPVIDWEAKYKELENELQTTQSVNGSLLNQLDRTNSYLKAIENKLELLEKLMQAEPKYIQSHNNYYSC